MPIPFHRTLRAFTLIELLMVVAIVATLLGLMLPAALGIASSSRLTNAGNQVHNLASLARQRAATNNTLTALILLGAQGATDDYRAFAVAEFQSGRGWVPVTGWEPLPEGIIVAASNLTECTFLLNSPNPFPFHSSPNLPLLHQDRPVSGSAYAARIFLPSGRLLDSETPSQLRLVEGFLQNGAVIYRQTDDAGQPANYYDITILGATGMTKTSRPN